MPCLQPPFASGFSFQPRFGAEMEHNMRPPHGKTAWLE